MKGYGGLAEQKRHSNIVRHNEESMQRENILYGTIAKLFVDEDGKWIKPLVKVRSNVVSRSSMSHGLIGYEDAKGQPGAWIRLGNQILDIALRFGTPKIGDDIKIVYKGNDPAKGTAYIVENKGKESAKGADETKQDVYIIYPPGSGSALG